MVLLRRHLRICAPILCLLSITLTGGTEVNFFQALKTGFSEFCSAETWQCALCSEHIQTPSTQKNQTPLITSAVPQSMEWFRSAASAWMRRDLICRTHLCFFVRVLHLTGKCDGFLILCLCLIPAWIFLIQKNKSYLCHSLGWIYQGVSINKMSINWYVLLHQI